MVNVEEDCVQKGIFPQLRGLGDGIGTSTHLPPILIGERFTLMYTKLNRSYHHYTGQHVTASVWCSHVSLRSCPNAIIQADKMT